MLPYYWALGPSQLRLVRLPLLSLRRRRVLHHDTNLGRCLGEVVLELGRVPLQARDRPTDVVVANRVRQPVAVGYNCKIDIMVSVRTAVSG